MRRPLAASLIAFALAGAGRLFGEDIYKWTDPQGQLHYSNRGGTPSDDSNSGGSGEQGWESVLERQKRGEDVQEKADVAINSIELQLIRKRRDRTQAQEMLEATQAAIVRAQASAPGQLPMLKAREATQISELRKIDAEIGSMELSIAKLRALKTADKEQRSGR